MHHIMRSAIGYLLLGILVIIFCAVWFRGVMKRQWGDVVIGGLFFVILSLGSDVHAGKYFVGLVGLATIVLAAFKNRKERSTSSHIVSLGVCLVFLAILSFFLL